MSGASREVRSERGLARRVSIRPPCAADERELSRLREASWDFLAPWESAPPPAPFGEEWFATYIESAARDDTERLLICRADDGAIVGGANISAIVRGAFHCGFLGYWIGGPFARQGLMSEALPLVLDHAFGALSLHRVEANVRPENTASIALVRRSGFRREGFSPKYLRISGEWRDHERWALLAEEWRAR